MKQKLNFSYYELSLLSFLKESHPELATDVSFIKSRAESAAAAYAEAFDNGYAIPSCAEIAGDALYAGLRFSRHDTIVNVLWNEFSGVVPQGSAAATMLPWSQRDTKSACRGRTYYKSIAARGGPRRVNSWC